jgi:GNAT superfamily N-acetyltransferase
MTTKSGFYKHGKSHEDGGIPVLVDSSSPIEVELHEYKICSNAMESTKIFEFKDKTNKEILDEIFQYSDCEFKQNEANSGDFIICKLAVLDKKKRNITGTAKEIINVMQSEKSCNVTNDSKEYKDGGSLNQRNLIYIGDVGSSNVDESKKINLGKNEYDNKNRYEISDKDLELINFDNLYKQASENKGKIFVVKLNEIIKHDTLFEAYPDLKNIDVEYKYDEKDKGFSAYNLINNNIKYNFYGEDEFIKSMENALRKNGKSLPTNEQLSRRRFALRRRVLLHELQHYVQYYENHGQGSSWLREYRRILQERGIDERTISTNERNILIDESKKLNRSYLGEMESKDVEFRINLTLDERKNKKPFELLPYTVDSVIVKLKDNKLKDGGKINNEYIIFFKSKLNNDIIYSNVKAESLQSAIDRTKSLYNWTEILWIKGFELKESNEGVQFFYEAIKNYWSSNKFINVDLVDGQIIFTGYGNSVAFDFIAKFLKKENDIKVFDGGYLFNDDLDIEINPDFTFDDSKIIEYLTQYKNGGEINDNDETYTKWKKLVNMSKSELEKFYNSEDGKKAGLSASEAKSQGIDSGRESARWIMKMKDTPESEWTSDMWRWAKKQISFISRMSGMKGNLYDDKGNKTRKHTSLLIWGHNPEKYNDGGEINKNDKIMNDIKLSSRAIIDVNGEKLVKEIYGNKEHLIELLYSLDSKNLFQIYYIFVSKDIRRLGIGSKLMDLAKNKAIELGFDNILCLVADYKGEDYDNLVSFYKKNGFEFVENSDKKMALKLDTEFNNGSLKLMKWYIDWYKGISDKMNITLSLPNLLSPFKENNVVIMDLFEKIDQTIDAKKYLQEIINKADEYKVTLYLEPIPRYKYFLDDAEKIRRISKEYLISYYEKFGFELTPNRQFMKRNFKEQLKKGGELTTNESCEKYIKEQENIFKNGYYSFVKNIGIFADSYGGKMPKIDSLIIISYNSGGQNNLKVTDTINPVVLQKQIGELIEEESGIPKIIISKHLTSSKRVSENIYDIIKNNNVIIIDRDEVVCSNLINKLKNGGELKTKEMENKNKEIGNIFEFTSKVFNLILKPISEKYNFTITQKEEKSTKTPTYQLKSNINSKIESSGIIKSYIGKYRKLDIYSIAGSLNILNLDDDDINRSVPIYYEFLDGSIDFNEAYNNIDNQFKEYNELYLSLQKGIAIESEHKETAEKLYNQEITPDQAAESIAKEHLAESPKYYKELEKMESKLKTGSEDILKIALKDVISVNKYANLDYTEAKILYSLNPKKLNEDDNWYYDSITQKDEVLKSLYNMNYVTDDTENGKYDLSELGKDFIKSVDARIETLNSVEQGLDLFPQEANILEHKEDKLYNDIKSCLISEGEDDTSYIFEGKEFINATSGHNERWKFVSFFKYGAVIEHIAKNRLTTKKENIKITFDEIKKMYEDGDISIDGINNLSTLNNCLKLLSKCIDIIDANDAMKYELESHNATKKELKNYKKEKEEKAKKERENKTLADDLTFLNKNVLDSLGIESNQELYSNKDSQYKYKEAMDKFMFTAIPSDKLPLDKEVHDILEDENEHLLNQYLYLSGIFGEKEKTKWIEFLKNLKPESKEYFLDENVYLENKKPETVNVPETILPKDGSDIYINMPKMGHLAEKNITLKYDNNNFTFDIYSDNKKTGTITEREVLNNIENGLYKVIKKTSEQKEWKDAISTFNELISIGGSESELKEWNEAIDTFKMLLGDDAEKFAKGGNIGNESHEELERMQMESQFGKLN